MGNIVSEITGFFQQGGIVMVLLLLTSIASLAIFLFRAWYLRRAVVIPQAVRSRILTLSRDGKFERAEEFSSQSGTSFGRIAEDLLSIREWSDDARRERIRESGKREAARLEKYAGSLGTIATISPLLGLLGTIVGMIETFRSVQKTAEQTGVPSVAEMADGIWQALLTTAAGLVIAIPAFVGYRWLTARVDKWTLELEEASAELLHTLFQQMDAEQLQTPAEESPDPEKSEALISAANPETT